MSSLNFFTLNIARNLCFADLVDLSDERWHSTEFIDEKCKFVFFGNIFYSLSLSIVNNGEGTLKRRYQKYVVKENFIK